MVATHGVSECAAKQENKGNKELGKFRPKKQKKNSDKKETHNWDFAEEPLNNANALKLLTKSI